MLVSDFMFEADFATVCAKNLTCLKQKPFLKPIMLLQQIPLKSVHHFYQFEQPNDYLSQIPPDL